jgi:ATP-binding cassette, subfamily B, bacterial PglK
MRTIKKFLFLLSGRERKQLGLLIFMMTIMALLDTIGVVSILPFVAVLTNPSLVDTNLILNSIFLASSILGIENNQQFLFFLGGLVFITLVVSLLFKVLTTYVQTQFIYMQEYNIGKRLVEGYLCQPYSWFLNRNSANFGTTILSEVNQIIETGIRPLTELISKGMISIVLIIVLFIADSKLALIVGLTLGGSYWLVFYSIRVYIKKIGEIRFENNQKRFLTISEAFGAIKEVKVSGLEQFYINFFSNSAQKYSKSITSANFLSAIPRSILEIIVFGGIMLMILYLMKQTGSFNNSLPMISLYVFAGYRLMPALQQIYVSVTTISYISPSLDKLYEDINKLKSIELNQDQGYLPFNKIITLKNVNYNYPNTSRTILKNINLSIFAKTTVGLIGTTGSGKTTMVDIILGLLEAQMGTLEIDGQIITKQNSRAWQRSIGYVPQHIYLSDNTLADNIALGIDSENINLEAIEKASKIANLHDFVVNELPEKYQTIVGERGVRLSGGQRQRIGIARALYNNPNVLILDEATSALDNQTEQAVMDAINNLGKNITIILIAHRLSTVKKCDKIFLLEDGKLKKEGTFEELIKDNNNF